MNTQNAREQVAQLYDAEVAPHLASTLTGADRLIAQLSALSEEEKGRVAQAATALIESRTGQEAFVSPDPVASLVPLARNVKALQRFFDAVKNEAPATLGALEKNAATNRYETLNQFSETVGVLAAAVGQALPERADLKQTAEQLANDARQVENGIAGAPDAARPKDDLFLHALREMKTSQSTGAAPAEAEIENIRHLFEHKLSHPMQSIARTAAKLKEKLAALPEVDRQKLRTLTEAYGRQSTLPDMKLPQDHDIPAALDGLTANMQGLQSLLANVSSGKKTQELTAAEQAAADAGAWQTANDLRMPARALAAIATIANHAEDGQAFNAENMDRPGAFDEIIRLSGKISDRCREMQNAITSPGMEASIKTAVDAYRQRPVDVPSPALSDATARPVGPQQDQSRGAA